MLTSWVWLSPRMIRWKCHVLFCLNLARPTAALQPYSVGPGGLEATQILKQGAQVPSLDGALPKNLERVSKLPHSWCDVETDSF